MPVEVAFSSNGTTRENFMVRAAYASPGQRILGEIANGIFIRSDHHAAD